MGILTGFGNQPFGNNTFGGSDWAEVMLWRLIPEFYRREDQVLRGRVADPLRGFIDAIKPPFAELKVLADDFSNLWDADEIPLAQLPALAYNLGIDSATTKSEVFQRLEIINAVQLYLNKGTDKGYQIAASFEGLVVTITPLWADNCEPNSLFFETGPNQFLAKIDEIPADAMSADSVFTDPYAQWPTTLHPIRVTGDLFFDSTPLDTVPLDSGNSFIDPRCRSYSLRLFFEKPDDTEIEDYADVANRTLLFLEKMRPMHVSFDRVRFDGTKAAAYWTLPIVGDIASEATAYWTGPISGLQAAAAYWTDEIDSEIIT